jgi:hypothetical protein
MEAQEPPVRKYNQKAWCLEGKKICTVISTLGQQEKLQLENTALSGPGKLLVGKNSPLYTSK